MNDVTKKGSDEKAASSSNTPQTDSQDTKKKGNKALVIVLVIIVSLIVLGMVFSFVILPLIFKNVFKKSLETATNGKVKVTDNGVTVKSGDTTISSEGKLPDGFPSDVPKYNGGKIVYSAKSNDLYYVTFSTTDAPKKAFDNYKESLKSNGWTAGDSSSEAFYGDTYTINLEKDNRKVNATVTPDGNGSNVAVTVGPKD
jgi:uncharacterized membrane protein YgcG